MARLRQHRPFWKKDRLGWDRIFLVLDTRRDELNWRLGGYIAADIHWEVSMLLAEHDTNIQMARWEQSAMTGGGRNGCT